MFQSVHVSSGILKSRNCHSGAMTRVTTASAGNCWKSESKHLTSTAWKRFAMAIWCPQSVLLFSVNKSCTMLSKLLNLVSFINVLSFYYRFYSLFIPLLLLRSKCRIFWVMGCGKMKGRGSFLNKCSRLIQAWRPTKVLAWESSSSRYYLKTNLQTGESQTNRYQWL